MERTQQTEEFSCVLLGEDGAPAAPAGPTCKTAHCSVSVYALVMGFTMDCWGRRFLLNVSASHWVSGCA